MIHVVHHIDPRCASYTISKQPHAKLQTSSSRSVVSQEGSSRSIMISSRNNYGTDLSEREVARNCLILHSSGTSSSSSSLSSSTDSERVNIEDGWLINANLLFVGPKIGEGAYSKVYEGKYVCILFLCVCV